MEVLDHRVRAGTREYRVKWEGGAEGWVPRRNLENVHERILEYEKKLPTQDNQEEEETENLSKELVEEEEVLSDKRNKSKKTTLQKELKNLATVGRTEGK